MGTMWQLAIVGLTPLIVRCPEAPHSPIAERRVEAMEKDANGRFYSIVVPGGIYQQYLQRKKDDPTGPQPARKMTTSSAAATVLSPESPACA